MTQGDLIRIDPFDINTNETIPIDTLVLETHMPLTSPTTTAQPSLEIEDHSPSRQSTRPRKSTKLLNFAYSSCSTSFVSFFVSLHSISEHLSYREAVVDPFWQPVMAEELTALHQTHT